MKPDFFSVPVLVLIGLAGATTGQSTSDPPNQSKATRSSPSERPQGTSSRRTGSDYSYSNSYPYHSRTAPQPPQYHRDFDPGYRNPGGVGRRAEYYGPPETFERPSVPERVARFGDGPSAISREAQIRAQQQGIERTQTLNQHIDAYGRPLGVGYGYGFGFLGGIPF